MSKSRINALVGKLLGEDTGWKPRPSDVAWTANLVRKVKDGGIWGIPMSNSAYRVNHTKRQLELIEGDALDMHDKVTKCCALMDPPYHVVIAPERRQNLKTN